LACAALIALFMGDLIVRPGGVHLTRTIDDIAEMVAAATAAGVGTWQAMRSTRRLRISWALIAAGCAGWAIGEAVWCYYELLQHRDTPFPSLADAGFLVFPVLALIGLLVRPSAAFAGQGRVRVALDATLISASLFLVSWVTALGEVYAAGADSTFAEIVSLAYPVSDLVLLTVAVVVLTYARTGDRSGLGYIATGLIGLCIADSGFAYLTAIDHYGEVNLIDAGWVGGFLVIALAGLLDRSTNDTETRLIPPRTALLLPYLPATVAIATALHELSGDGLDRTGSISATVLVAVLVARQMLVLLDNRALMSRISHQAFHDVLTGLANRALFSDRLEHALDLHRRDLRQVTVLLLDLDDFKTVNDSLGHPAGDELLVRVTERLCATVRTGDTVARLGGDEFAILMEDGGDPFDTAGRILMSLDRPVSIAGRDLTVRVSIGLATLQAGEGSVDATEMLKRADVAMYAAKREGKGKLVPYTAALAGGDSEQLDLHAALLSDVGAGRIDVAYQPVHLANGTIRGFEALARWSYQGKPVSPATFLPAAEKAGVLARLDETVLRKAAAEAAGWAEDVYISVNLSSVALGDLSFATRVATILHDAGVSPGRLSVEVLETTAIEADDVALQTIRALRSLGVRVTVDDFGAGYASLARLRALQPDVIKVDRSLLADENDPSQPSALLTGITELAHRLGAWVVAEGIETETQHGAAIAAGCDAMQGYLLGHPTTPERCREMLDERAPAPQA
jgi:diguanylate cyclase (GGDEF)-like protein